MNMITAGLFSPIGANVTLAVGTSSSSVALNPTGNTGGTVRLINVGGSVAHVAFGGAGVAATNPGSMPLGPNTDGVFDFPPGATNVAAIASATGNTLHIQAGMGI